MAKLVKFLEGRPLVGASGELYDVVRDGTMGPPTEASFTLSTPEDVRIVFHGDFTISGGVITDGTATGFDLFLGSTKLMKATGAAVSYADLASAIADAVSTFSLTAFNGHFNSGATIKGSNEEDHLEGAVGGKLLGRDGNDYISTFQGFTLAKGGDGDDILVGNGESRLVGQEGEDIFVVWGPDADALKGGDFFKDFSVKDDVVALHPSLFEGPPEGYLADSYFHVGKAAETADHHVIYDRKTGGLYWDEDGLGGAAQAQVARLPDHLKLKADNIFMGDFV